MIVRTPHRDRFVVIDKTALEDSRLSWRARGLLAYLLTKPDNWRVLVAQLVSAGPDGRTSVRAGLTELESAGYITRSQGRRDGGQWDSADVQVFEKPQVTTAVGKPDSGRDQEQCTHEVTKVQVATAVGFPDDGFADAGKTPPSENRLIVKTENSFSPCVRDALQLIAERRCAETREAGLIRNERAYRRAVLADVRAEHGSAVAALIAANPRITTEEVAAMIEPHDVDRAVHAPDPSSIADAERRRAAWSSAHPGEGVPLLSAFMAEEVTL
jgi:hypothetical protein